MVGQDPSFILLNISIRKKEKKKLYTREMHDYQISS